MPSGRPAAASDLRLDDLRNRTSSPQASKLMNTKIPTSVSDAIMRVVEETGASKTEAVVALLNEGLDTVASDSELGRRYKEKSRSRERGAEG